MHPQRIADSHGVMPPRKSKQLVGVLRGEILSGQRTPGAKLPTYSALRARFGVARPTISRGVKAMVSEGLVTVDPRRGMFVAMKLPHHNRYLWVSSERPGGTGWTSLSATLLELIERGETGIAGDVVPLVGVDGRMNNPAYQSLCDAVEQRSAAGLLLMGSATISLLPIMQTPGLARVAVGVPAPHAALLGLDYGQLIERASQWLRSQAGGIAIFSPHATTSSARKTVCCAAAWTRRFCRRCTLRLSVARRSPSCCSSGPIGPTPCSSRMTASFRRC